MAADSNGHGRHKHDIAEAQQQRGEELEAIGESLSVVRAAPAVPACDQGELLSLPQHSQGLAGTGAGNPLPSTLERAGVRGFRAQGEGEGAGGRLSPALHSQAAYR